MQAYDSSEPYLLTFVEEAERLEAERAAAEGLSFKSCRIVKGVRSIAHYHFCFDKPHARE